MIIDIIVIVVLLISAIIAFLRGFIRETLTILGGLGGLIAARMFGSALAPIIQGWLGVVDGETPEKIMGVLPADMLGTGLAYGGIFIIVVIVLSIVSHLIAESVRLMGLGAIDRTFGVIFGLARGILVLGLLYLPVYLMVEEEQKAEWFGSSKTHFYLESTSGFLAGFIPETASDDIEGVIEEGALSTREKLEMIDVLKKIKIGNGLNLDSALGDAKSGYSENFREEMDRLFEEETNYNE